MQSFWEKAIGTFGEGWEKDEHYIIFGSVPRYVLKGIQPPCICKLAQVWELIEGGHDSAFTIQVRLLFT